MPNVLLLHVKNLSDALVTTSLVKRLVKDGNSVDSVSDAASEPLFQFSGARPLRMESAVNYKYDVVVNLSPSYSCAEAVGRLTANVKLGFSVRGEKLDFYNDGAKRYYDAVHYGQDTKSNLFQLTYSVADLVWQGEGYGLTYYPRNRTKKSLTGLGLKNERLKSFLSANLKLERSRTWQIPFKKNILKHLDEINRCKHIVTDDEVTMHAALALRKNVEYLVSSPPAFKVEMFGSGNILQYDIDSL